MKKLKSFYTSISWKYCVVGYLFLLACSFLYLTFTQNDSSNEFITHLSSDNIQKPIVLLIPDQQNLDNLGDLDTFLSTDFNLLVADYRELYNQEDNKKRFHASDNAQILVKQLEKLQTRKVHIVAQGFGGIIAANAIAQSPDAFSSITFINPSGLQEYELLGGYAMNKAVYGAQTGFWWGAYYLIPHFGFLKSAHLKHQFNRANYQTDRRDLREIFKQIKIPTLIEQKTNRKFETFGISKEIERLVPQSVFKEYDVTEMGYVNSEEAIKEFILSVNQGDIIQPSQERIAIAKLPFEYKNVIKAEGWTLIALMLLIVFSTFISEDLACIGAGLMVARGLMGFWPAMLAGLLGILVGDVFIYLAGRWLGKSAVTRKPFSWFINEQDLERSYHWFKTKGPIIIIASRFIPGTRFPTYFSAGILGASFFMFMSYFVISSIVWTPLIVGLSMALGQQMMDYFTMYQGYAMWLIIGLVAFVYLFIKLVVPLFTYRGRRTLKGKFIRKRNWSFWPTSILYFPVGIYLIYLWIKHRSISLFIATNPNIEGGEIVRESKSKILEQINEQSAVAPFIVLKNECSLDENLSLCDTFIDNQEINYPVVLKPDSGKNGKGVKFIQNRESLENELKSIKEVHLLQKFVEGQEFEIFYYRYPNEAKGHIFSITRKELHFLTGDGEKNIEELILRDDRAICLADLHLQKFMHELYDIPEQGERVPLVELGTHSKGALFFDGEEFKTPELAVAIDRISKSFNGFYFGRYDVKVPTEEHLMKGEGILALELNGVTSVSTNIYDPKYGFKHAVRILAKQWEIAYKIGSINAKKGLKKTGTMGFIKQLVNTH